MNGTPQIYTTLEVGAAGFSKGAGTQYDLTDQDNIEITIEEQTTVVEDGQTIIDALDGSVNILLYDLDVLSDTNVQDDTTIVSAAKLILYGATGTNDLAFDNVRIRGRKDYGQNRIGARIQASIRSTSEPFATS